MQITNPLEKVLADIFNNIRCKAVEILKSDKYLHPTGFVISPADNGGKLNIYAVPINYSDDKQKYEMYRRLNTFASSVNAVGIIHVSEAWFAKTNNESEVLNTRPSEHPNRKECIIATMTANNLKKSEIVEFSRGKDGSIKVGESLLPETEKGVLQDNLITAFNCYH